MDQLTNVTNVKNYSVVGSIGDHKKVSQLESLTHLFCDEDGTLHFFRNFTKSENFCRTLYNTSSKIKRNVVFAVWSQW